MSESEQTTPKTNHQQSMAAIYAKHDAANAANIPVDTSEDGFADARKKIEAAKQRQIAEETGEDEEDEDIGMPTLPLSEVRDKRFNDLEDGDDIPDAMTEEGKREEGEREESDDDPLAEYGMFFNEDGELCTTVNVYGEEQVIPVSQIRRDYQTHEAAQRKFMDAARLARRAKELQEQQAAERLSQPAEPSDDDVLDQIADAQAQANEHFLAGDTDEYKKAMREVYRLEDLRRQQSAPSQQALPPDRTETQLTDEEMAANAWFAANFSQIQAKDEYLNEARRQFNLVRQEREDFGLPALSPFDLVREAGIRTERYLQTQGVNLDRQARTQRRRNADAPPDPASVAARKGQLKSGATVSEDELNRQRAATVSARKRLQEQFRAQRR